MRTAASRPISAMSPAAGRHRATSRAARPRQPRGRDRLHRRPGRDSGAPLDDTKLQRHVDDFKAAAAHYGTQAFADTVAPGDDRVLLRRRHHLARATQMPELEGARPTMARRRRSRTCRISERRSSASTRTTRTTSPTRAGGIDRGAGRGRRHLPDQHLPRHAARLPQRHRSALERGAGPRGLERHRRLVRDVREGRLRRGDADGLRIPAAAGVTALPFRQRRRESCAWFREPSSRDLANQLSVMSRTVSSPPGRSTIAPRLPR